MSFGKHLSDQRAGKAAIPKQTHNRPSCATKRLISTLQDSVLGTAFTFPFGRSFNNLSKERD
ncbi:hypothetical protein [Phormidesmis priestleyi]